MSDVPGGSASPDVNSERVADDARLLGMAFKNCVEIYADVASGISQASALPLLAWATADAATAACRLSAVADFPAPTEPHAEEVDFDMEAMRRGLSNALEGVDAYFEVADPRKGTEVVEGSITEDILTAVSGMRIGLQFLEDGNPAEALWWWQYSCFATWGERVGSALQMLQLLLSEARLASDHELVREARKRAAFRWEGLYGPVA
jgi:hypothetical protein